MSGFRSERLFAICSVVAALAVPLAYAIWLRANNSFIGGLTMIGSSDGRLERSQLIGFSLSWG